MDQGQIVELGDPRSVLVDPKETRTKAFINAVRH
jgi:polar amino acid transport system ATP-binding protein